MSTDFIVPLAFTTSANPVQLAEEAAAAAGETVWPASFTYHAVNEWWVYRVDLDLDGGQVAAVQAALDAHDPDPSHGQSADKVRGKSLSIRPSLTDEEREEAILLLLRALP